MRLPGSFCRDVSEKNREGKRTARERLADEREKQKAAEQAPPGADRGRGGASACWPWPRSIGVVAANAGKDDGDDGGPGRGALGGERQGQPRHPVGQGRAPSRPSPCGRTSAARPASSFEDTYRSTIHELRTPGSSRSSTTSPRIIDGNMGGSGSLHAANAAACAQDAGKFPAYHDVLYQNQPPRRRRLRRRTASCIELAGKVDGLDTARVPQVRRGRHARQLGAPSPTRPSRAAASAAPRPSCSTARTSTQDRADDPGEAEADGRGGRTRA